MEFLSRFKNALFLIAVLLAQAIALAVQVRTPANAGAPDGREVRLIRMWTSATVTPFERVAYAIGSGAHFGWQDYIDLRHVRQRNQDLQQQLTRMRIEQAAIAEDALQGRRLQALLAFKEQYVGSTVAAQVIGESGSDTSHVLTIDKGSRDGLRPDMPVITPDGIVGKLRHPAWYPDRPGPDRQSHRRLAHQTRRAGAYLRRRPGFSPRAARRRRSEHCTRP
jgi:rod shape-determining protein MreC